MQKEEKNLVTDYVKSKVIVNGSFISWEDLKLLPKNTYRRLNEYWKIIQQKKKKKQKVI